MTYKDWINEENLIKLEAWARDGLTDEDIAKNIGISRTTLYEWKNKYVDIMNALKKGKEVADIVIENALYKRASGYDTVEDTIEYAVIDGVKVEVKRTQKVRHIPADITAQIFWLKNRKPNKWREKNNDDEEKNNDIINKLQNMEIKFVNGGIDEKDRSN